MPCFLIFRVVQFTNFFEIMSCLLKLFSSCLNLDIDIFHFFVYDVGKYFDISLLMSSKQEHN